VRGAAVRTLAAVPALFRIGVAETVAYRAEFLIWMLTTTLPLIMLGLWTSVAAEAPFAAWGTRDFVAYFLAALIVRNLTGSWVVWGISDEVRRGVLSIRLLKPIHPFVVFAVQHLAAVPLRCAIALPFALILLLSSGRDLLIHDPLRLAILAAALLGAWLVTFFAMILIGSLAMYIDKAYAVFDVYLGLFAVLSGYLLPIELLPPWVGRLAAWLPFRGMLGFPVELAIGRLDAATAARELAIQWGYVGVMIAGALAIWTRGIRRYEAFGG
jgi:ABC-2 type transport system permease protein